MNNPFKPATILAAIATLSSQGDTPDHFLFLRLRDHDGFIRDLTIDRATGDEFKGCRALLRREWKNAKTADLFARLGNHDASTSVS